MAGLDWGLFKHSNKFDQGMGKVRAGMGTLVVANDGSGDFDTIVEAIKALPTTGGVIYVKDGTYYVTTMLNLNKANSAIIGASKSTIIQTIGNIIALRVSAADCKIEKIHIKGSGTGNLNWGIEVTADNVSIEDVYIELCYQGIFVDTHDNCIIRGCFIYDNKANGVVFTTISGENDKNILTSNSIYSNDKSGVGITTATRNIIANNLIYGNVEHGINMTSSVGNVISNNVIKDNDSGDTASFDGIYLSQTDDDNTIIGNYLEGNDRYQINLAAGTDDDNIIVGNIIDATGATGGINDAGTGTQQAHNTGDVAATGGTALIQAGTHSVPKATIAYDNSYIDIAIGAGDLTAEDSIVIEFMNDITNNQDLNFKLDILNTSTTGNLVTAFIVADATQHVYAKITIGQVTGHDEKTRELQSARVSVQNAAASQTVKLFDTGDNNILTTAFTLRLNFKFSNTSTYDKLVRYKVYKILGQ